MTTESMEDAEMEQRRIDRFWGLDLEVTNRRKEVASMGLEDLLSKGQEKQRKVQADQSLWEAEMKEEEDAETLSRARIEMQERKRYLKTLYNSDNASQAVIDYSWNSRICVPSSTDASTLRRRELKISYDTMAHQQVTQQLAGLQCESPSPSIHGGKITGLLDKQYFDDDIEQPQDNDLMHRASHASPKHLLILSRILESSDDVLTNEGRDLTDPTDDRIWGHQDFKWNQLPMLETVFQKLLRCSDSATIDDSSSGPGLRVDMGQSVGNVLKEAFQKLDGETQRMISYTVFGSWIKRNRWELFSEFFGREGDGVYVFTVIDWLDLASMAAFETKISRSRVRTNKEHCDFVKLETKLCRRRPTVGLSQSNESSVLWPPSMPLVSNHNQSSSSSLPAESSVRGSLDEGGNGTSDYARWFAAKSRAHLDDAQRRASITRQLTVGDLVWCQHGQGFRWLPAVVVKMHISLEGEDENGGGGGDVLSCDLAYLMTHDSFIAAYEDALSMTKLIAKVTAGISVAAETKQGTVISPWYFRDPLDAEFDLCKSLYDRIALSSNSGNSRGLRAALQSVGGEFRSSVAAAAVATCRNDSADESKLGASLPLYAYSTAPASTAETESDATLYATILGSAALSATFLGSTLTSRKAAPNAKVALRPDDWQAAITHACTAAPGNEIFADGALCALDIVTYNR